MSKPLLFEIFRLNKTHSQILFLFLTHGSSPLKILSLLGGGGGLFSQVVWLAN